VLCFEQIDAQCSQQIIYIGKSTPLARSWYFQNAAYNHRLGKGAILSLCADNQRAIRHWVGFHAPKHIRRTPIKRQSDAKGDL